MFDYTGPWAVFAWFAGAVTVVAVYLIVADARRTRRRLAAEAEESAYQLFAARDLADFTPLSARSGWVDPITTLTEQDVAMAVEHVAPGVGSLTAFAAALPDTSTTRTPTEQRELEAAWEPAHAEHAERLDREFFAEFDTAMEAALTDWAIGVRVVGKLERKHHRPGEDDCPRCTAIVHEDTDEHRRIVSQYDTGAYDLAELRKLLVSH